MSNNEVKPSFSLRYLLLTLFTTIIIAGVGLGFAKYFESKPVKEIVIFDTDIVNLLDDKSLPKEQIEASYFLKKKDGSKQKIESLFRTKTIIKNNGNEGIENMLLSVTIKQENAKLVGAPGISSEPQDIISAISIKKIENESDEQRHTWTISLLNPGESIVLDYSIYSEKKLESIEFLILPRKKDWKVTRQPLLSKLQKEGPRWYMIVLGVLGALITVPILILLFTIPFYTLSWSTRTDFREFYGSFTRFYWEHPPKYIFESKSKASIRFKEKLEEQDSKNAEEAA